MNERTTINPADLNLNPDQFLTGVNMQRPEEIPKEILMKSAGGNIPDLHNTNEKPTTASQRKEIKQSITTVNLKEEIQEEKIKQEVDAAKKSKEPIKIDKSKKPKEVLKSLIAKGDYQETVDLFGATWTIRALDHRDIIIAFDTMKDNIETQAGRLSALMYSQVLSSIEAINGYPLTEWFTDVNIGDYLTREAYLIGIRTALKSYMDHMASSIIDSLYAEYRKIEDKRNKALDELKN